MEFSPRTSADAFHAQLQDFPDLSSANVVATGQVAWNMATDAPQLAAGSAHSIMWYRGALASVDPLTDESLNLGPMSAFAIVLSRVVRTGTGPFYLYDECGEVRLLTPQVAGQARALAHSWLWYSTDGSFDGVVETQGDYMLLAYEGAALVPNLTLLPGMVAGSTPADASVVWEFRLYDMPFSQFGAGRILIPSPASAPPFMPVGAQAGTFLFSARAGAPFTPGSQPGPYPRVFRTKKFNAVLDVAPAPLSARVFGGPWYAQATAAVDGGASNGQWVMAGLLPETAPTSYTPPNVDAVHDPACALSSGRVLDAVQITGVAAAPTNTFNQIVLTYPR